MVDMFLKRKDDILNKSDKSSIGGWDEKIKSLCEKLNNSDDSYSASSCSGRIVVLQDTGKKAPGLFQFVSHDLVKLNDLKKFFEKISSDANLKFKSEPPIIHAVFRSAEGAESFLSKAREIGFKRGGIISLGNKQGKGIIVEIVSTEKLEFPVVVKGKLIVSDDFLKIILERANDNLKKGWDKIEKLRKKI